MEEIDQIKPAGVTLKSGKQLNVAIVGSGRAILFLHGFPGTWYTWRHQLVGLSDLGYQAIAPDLRGYGGSTAPDEWSSYSTPQIIGDLVDLLDQLNLDKVFLVGHDWGAIVAWHFCLLRPDKVTAMVNTSVAFMLRNPPPVSPVDAFEKEFGEDFYICRFQDPEKVNDELSRWNPEQVVNGFYDLFGKPLPPCFEKFDGNSSKPSFLRQKDVKHYADTFHKTGYTGGFNYFRAIELTWKSLGCYEDVKITTPVKFVVGEQDFAYNLGSVKEYISNGGLENDVPNVEIALWPEVGHFLNEEEPEKLNELIYYYFYNIK